MSTRRDDGALGAALVGAQLGLLALLAGCAAMGLRDGSGTPADAALAGAAGVALGLWAVTANRPGNFNIAPAPRQGGQLVQHGPYRWIRHPMYSALLLAGYAAVRTAGGGTWAWVAAGAWVALAAVLAAKAAVEERGMLAAHPGYAAYRQRTARFIPGVF